MCVYVCLCVICFRFACLSDRFCSHITLLLCYEAGHMVRTDASDGQAVWQPGGAEEDSRLREGNRHLHLAYDDGEEEEDFAVLDH